MKTSTKSSTTTSLLSFDGSLRIVLSFLLLCSLLISVSLVSPAASSVISWLLLQNNNNNNNNNPNDHHHDQQHYDHHDGSKHDIVVGDEEHNMKDEFVEGEYSFMTTTAPYLRRGRHRLLDEQSSTTTTLITEEEEQCTETCCQQFTECSTSNEEEAASPLGDIPFSVQIIMIVLLLFLSALFSGLTLGLMSLDKTGLEIVMDGDDPINASYARKIYPLRKNGNLLLCTLLLGNVAVNSLLSILLADKVGGTIGLLASTFLIVIFGEIVPQALCSRYALFIGSTVVPVVRIIVIMLYPIAKPLAFALDVGLGNELVTTYSNGEMLKLLQIHVQEKVIDHETANTMKGALEYKDRQVATVMTPLANTFMLDVNEKLSYETIAKIFKTGYSRIPVYEISKNNIIGLLFVKDLIFIDPEDDTRLADFIEIFGRNVVVVWPDDKLGDVLRELKQGKSHLAIVRDVHQPNIEDYDGVVDDDDLGKDPFYEIKGIITLEDIIEEILGDEIVDETDAYVDGTHAQKVDRSSETVTDAFKWERLRLLHSKIVDSTLSIDETKAVTAHLVKNHDNVFSTTTSDVATSSSSTSLLTENQLHKLIAETTVTVLPTAKHEIGYELPNHTDLLYEKNIHNDVCTLILSGKVTVACVGDGNFRTDVASWSLLGANALIDTSYRPDFTAYVSAGPCRCLRITRERFAQAVDASTLERRQQQHKQQQQQRSGGSGGSSNGTTTLVSDVVDLSHRSSASNSNMDHHHYLPSPQQQQQHQQSSSNSMDADISEQQQQQTRKAKLLSALKVVHPGIDDPTTTSMMASNNNNNNTGGGGGRFRSSTQTGTGRAHPIRAASLPLIPAPTNKDTTGGRGEDIQDNNNDNGAVVAIGTTATSAAAAATTKSSAAASASATSPSTESTVDDGDDSRNTTTNQSMT